MEQMQRIVLRNFELKNQINIFENSIFLKIGLLHFLSKETNTKLDHRDEMHPAVLEEGGSDVWRKTIFYFFLDFLATWIRTV